MAIPKPSSNSNPAAAARATTTKSTGTRYYQPLWHSAAASIAVIVVGRGDVRDVGLPVFVALCFLNVVLLFWSCNRFELSAPGSAARARARLAMWVLSSTLTTAFMWKLATLLPQSFAMVPWMMAAASAGLTFYVLFVEDKTK